jgi:hypothetical protein
VIENSVFCWCFLLYLLLVLKTRFRKGSETQFRKGSEAQLNEDEEEDWVIENGMGTAPS